MYHGRFSSFVHVSFIVLYEWSQIQASSSLLNKNFASNQRVKDLKNKIIDLTLKSFMLKIH